MTYVDSKDAYQYVQWVQESLLYRHALTSVSS